MESSKKNPKKILLKWPADRASSNGFLAWKSSNVGDFQCVGILLDLLMRQRILCLFLGRICGWMDQICLTSCYYFRCGIIGVTLRGVYSRVGGLVWFELAGHGLGLCISIRLGTWFA